MSSPIISIEGLSKKYILAHQNVKRHDTFRDMIVHSARSVFRPSSNAAASSSKEEFWALKDVSFEIKQGERVGIIGRNGAGKSTLLKILSRIVAPTAGRITIDGRVASLLEVGTGFHPELSGRENIFLNGAVLGMGKAEIKRKFDEIVSFSEVEKFLDTPVKRYSSGMYVRLAFAVAAHLEPEILIVDEVLAVGDADFQKKCLGKMKEVSGEGRTVLFVSHNMAAVQNLCNKAVVLSKGKVVFPMGDVSSAVQDYMRSSLDNSKIDLRDRKDREGEGNLRLINVEFINERNESQRELITGQYVKIKIEYECRKQEPLNNIAVAVAIYGDDGLLYTMLGNEFSSSLFNRIPPNGAFICELDKLPITAGKYLMNISVTQAGVTQDWVQEAVMFDVESGDFYGTGKIIPASHKSILIENKWTFM